MNIFGEKAYFKKTCEKPCILPAWQAYLIKPGFFQALAMKSKSAV